MAGNSCSGEVCELVLLKLPGHGCDNSCGANLTQVFLLFFLFFCFFSLSFFFRSHSYVPFLSISSFVKFSLDRIVIGFSN